MFTTETRQVGNHNTATEFFVYALTLLFITLKLLDITIVAQWSWIWVVSPIWLFFAISWTIALIGMVLVSTQIPPIIKILSILAVLITVGIIFLL